MLSGEAANTNFKVFGLTRPGLEPTIYLTWSEHHYATDAVIPELVWVKYTSLFCIFGIVWNVIYEKNLNWYFMRAISELWILYWLMCTFLYWFYFLKKYFLLFFTGQMDDVLGCVCIFFVDWNIFISFDTMFNNQSDDCFYRK